MEEKKIFLKMVTVLEDLKIPYMISGSVASILYGEPRLTNDIDVVVALKQSNVDLLTNSFLSKDFYVPPKETIIKEINRKGQFNIIHSSSGIKMDCIILKDTTFELEQFKRRKKLPFIDDKKAFICSPESIILNKMLFYKEGESEKHISDILGMLKVSEDQIDKSYIEQWSNELKVFDIWNTILEKNKKH